MAELALILVRSTINVPGKIKDTLHMLRLRNKHVCVIVPDNPSTRGMIRMVKDLITWGEVEAETRKLLEEKRGEKDGEGKAKPFFRLHPPRKGFERKGIKVPFKLGGVLGYRGKEINTLIQRMV